MYIPQLIDLFSVNMSTVHDICVVLTYHTLSDAGSFPASSLPWQCVILHSSVPLPVHCEKVTVKSITSPLKCCFWYNILYGCTWSLKPAMGHGCGETVASLKPYLIQFCLVLYPSLWYLLNFDGAKNLENYMWQRRSFPNFLFYFFQQVLFRLIFMLYHCHCLSEICHLKISKVDWATEQHDTWFMVNTVGREAAFKHKGEQAEWINLTS